jgi:hypothetical protein
MIRSANTRVSQIENISMTQQRISALYERRLNETTILPTVKMRTTQAFISVAILFVCLVGLSACQNFQQDQPTTDQTESATPTNIPSPIPSISSVTSTPATHPAFSNNFTYKSFSIGFPDDWTLLDMSIGGYFPLRERLSPLYGSGKVIALEKNGLYLIITIEMERGGSAGGIFLDDQEYDKFVSDKDKLVTEGTIIFLGRSHLSISDLLNTDSGPYGWSALAEYIPEVTTQSGEVYKGYENVIRRNGFLYNFIVVSDDSGNTTWQLQQEMLEIIESIEW